MSDGPIVLASSSPRRRALLDQIGVAYRVIAVDVDESQRSAEPPAQYALRVAADKARAGWLAGGRAVPALGADTVVVLDGEVLQKPAGREDALRMLERLSGRTHQVLSAVALVGGDGSAAAATRLCVSSVTFCDIPAPRRRAYWDSGEPADKAGAYGIQGLGAVFVSRLEGSYSGVVGLPLFETAQLLAACGRAPLSGR